MDTIEQNLNRLIATPSDINQHLQAIATLASHCEHITEMGVRDVVSTWAFLAGLKYNGKEKKVLRSYDIHKSKNIDEALLQAKNAGVDMVFTEVDVLKTEIEETELLFIDTLHTYTQLKKELALHAKKVKRFIVFHDTTTYGHKPEPASWQTPEIMQNYVQNDKGLMPAIEEFLAENKNWSIVKQYHHNNGLLIIGNHG